MNFDYFEKKERQLLFKGFSVSPLFYNFLIDSLPLLNINPDNLQANTPFKIIPVTDGKRISLIKAYKLWRAIEKTSGRSDIGLAIADLFTLSKAGIVGELFLNAKNLYQSIYVVKRFLSIIINNIDFRLEEIGENIVFYFDVVPRFIIPLSVTECYVKICYNWVRKYCNTDTLPIQEICFYSPKPPHYDYYKKNFPNSKTCFNCRQNFIILKKEIFYTKNSSAAKEFDYMVKHAQEIKKKINSSSTYSQIVTNQIIINMPEGKNGINHIADNLNISVSTLKRKLKQENTTFKFLTEYIRKNLALSMIKDPDISYEEISYLLGYSEYSPFFRAFKKWFNKSPSQYRELFNI